MADILSEVRAWRAKADELLAGAEGVRNEVARDELMQMAEGYERMADRMEELVIRRESVESRR